MSNHGDNGDQLSSYAGSEAPGSAAKKKDIFYKISAFQRRAMHKVLKQVTHIDETRDEEYGALFKRFVALEERTMKLISALERCSAAQSELFDAQSTMSDTLSEFYDVPSALQPVCGLNKESKNYMLTQVSPLLSQQWKEHVEGVGQTLMERFRAIRADDARRTRYVVDYDFYRHKRKTLEEESKKDSANSHKLADRIKDCDNKLREASEKYHTMNERLTTRLKIADEHKSTFLNSAFVASLAIENEMYTQGASEVAKLNAMCQDERVVQAMREQADHLSEWDGASRKMVPSVTSLSSVALSNMMSPRRQPAEALGAHQPPLIEKSEEMRTALSAGGFASGSHNTQGSSYSGPSPPTTGAVKSPQGGRPKKRVQALYAYEAAADTELDMRENDIITVLKEDDSGWWQGEVDGRIGWFPFNYVEIVE